MILFHRRNFSISNKVAIAFLSLFISFNTLAQKIDINSLPKIDIENKLNIVFNGQSGNSVTAISNFLENFNEYPNLSKFIGQRIVTIQDSIFGPVPFKLYIPSTYNPKISTPLILVLHGAVGLSNFENAEKEDPDPMKDDDPFYSSLCAKGYIVVKPYGDKKKNFSWVSNKFNTDENYTFNVLTKIICQLKKTINIDDNKIFSFGHSDGSDGTFALDVFKPSLFAGFVAYNSMLTNIFSKKIHLQNAINRPLYLVHSDKDDLRPMAQTKRIVALLDSLNVKINYKEYLGYTHEDLHLKKDFPRSLKFLDSTKRNPYSTDIYWETSSHLFEQCDWIIIKNWDLNLPNADWHKVYNVPSFNKTKQLWTSLPYYENEPSSAIKAAYKANVFTVLTSRVTQFDILISPKMVDLSKDVKVIVNGKTVFSGKVNIDQSFVRSQLKSCFDRKAIWVNAKHF